VAEIGMNYDGNLDIAHELIRQAKWAGADIAKFQFGWRDKPGEINHLNAENVAQLKTWCDYHEIEMMASIISRDALALARPLGLTRYKIASRTVVDEPDLVRAVLAEGRETYVSLGRWSSADWPFGPPHAHLRYLFCRSSYPTDPAELRGLPERFGEDGYYGYSDHCLGLGACLLALGRGAALIEKHFTLNKTSQVIRDHVLSATPDEFLLLTRLGREVGAVAAAVGGAA
jgi:sialic acid synthase SpsE